MRKKILLSFFIFLALGLFSRLSAYSAGNYTANSCPSAPYPVSNSISRGIQRIFGFNFLATQILESSIKKEILKVAKAKDLKVDVKIYSMGDLIAGKIKSFEISGKDLVFDDIYISEAKAKSLCSFSHINYKNNPISLNTPVYSKFEAALTEKELNKIVASSKYKSLLEGVKIKVKDAEIGKVDFRNLKSEIKGDKIFVGATMAYRIAPMTFEVPVEFVSKLRLDKDTIYLTDLKFNSEKYLGSLKPVMDLIEMNNIKIFDLKELKKQDFELNIKKLALENDKINIQGTLWLSQNIKF